MRFTPPPIPPDDTATSTVVALSRIARNVLPSTDVFSLLPLAERVKLLTVARRPGSGNGSGLSSSALTTVKTAVLTPMPTASVISATTVKPGVFRSIRNA